MTVQTHTQYGNVAQIFKQTAERVPSHQFLRELVFNGVQAAERAGGGKVYVDSVDMFGDVPKLRVWDTGDGMTDLDLIDRFAAYSAQARTAVNFGIGAKVSLVNVSPHGVVVTSLRDGKANQITMVRDANGEFATVVVNPSAATKTQQLVTVANVEDLPAEIQASGHGTTVVLLGTGDHDCTAVSLQPQGETRAKRWVSHTLMNRFARFPKGVEVHVNSYGVTAGRQDTRRIRGRAAQANKYVTGGAKHNADINVEGARGKVVLNGDIPAVAYWWVIPSEQVNATTGARTKRTPSSFYRLGGKAHLVIDDEIYHSSHRALQMAGVWANSPRIELQFEPGAGVTYLPSSERDRATVAGRDGMEVLHEWCEQFAAKLPAAVAQVVSTRKVKDTSTDHHGESIGDLLGEMASVSIRSSRGGHTGSPTGVVVEADTRSLVKRAMDKATGKGGSSKTGSRSSSSQSSATQAQDAAASSRELVEPDPNGSVKARSARAATPTAPDVVWVNHSDDQSDETLTEGHAGYYNAGAHTVVLNAKFGMLLRLIEAQVKQREHNVNSRPRVTEAVMDAYANNMRAVVACNLLRLNGDKSATAASLDENAMAVAASNVYQVNKRINVTLRDCKTKNPANVGADA